MSASTKRVDSVRETSVNKTERATTRRFDVVRKHPLLTQNVED